MAENDFNPQKELQSFNRQFVEMRKDILNRVNELRKSVGAGIVNDAEIKKQMKELDKFMNENVTKFGTKITSEFKSLSTTFTKIVNDQIKKMNKESFKISFKNFKNEIENVSSEINSKIGTSDFNKEALDDLFETYDGISLKMSEMIEFGKQEGILKTTALKNIKQQKQLLDDIIDNKKKELNALVGINDQLMAANSAIEDFVDTSLGFIYKIPGGGYFAQALGLDDIKEKIKSQVADTLRNSLTKGIDIAAGFKTALGGIVSTYAQLTKMLLLNPWAIAIAGLAWMIKLMIDLENSAEEFRRSTGLTIDQTKQLKPELENAALSMRKYGLNLEKVYSITSELYDNFKNIGFITPNLVKTLGLLKENLGISESTGAKVSKIFLGMSDVSRKNLDSWLATTAQLSEISGVAPIDVFNDIAENSELISKYFKGNTKEIITTTVAVRKLGLSLTDVGNIIDSAMDFEGSIEKELEASILLGKSINFNRARSLVFNGEIEKATEEIIRQVGTLDQFNKLNYIQKQALADATGLSVSRLQESLQTQKFINDLEREGKLTAADKLMLKVKEGELTKEDWLNQKRINSEISNLKNSFIAIGTALSRVILPVVHAMMPAVQVIADVLTSIVSGINSLVDGFENILPGSKAVAKQLAAWPLLLFAARKPLGGILSIFGKFGKGGFLDKILPAKTGGAVLEKSGKGLSSFFGFFKSIDLKSIGKFALISGILIASLVGLAFAIKQFEGIKWENVAMAGVALSGLTLIGFVIGKLPVSDILIGAAAILVLGASLVPLAYAMSLMENVRWETLGIAATALVGFSLAAFALGAVMFTGVGALLFGAGILSIIALGGAMIVLGTGVTAISNAFKTNSFIENFQKLAEIGPQLALTTAAIVGLSGALSLFSVASAGSGLLSTLTDFFGGNSLVDKIERIAEAGPGIQQVAEGLKTFRSIENAEVTSLNVPESVDIPAEITNIDAAINSGNDKLVKKLDEVIKAIRELNLNIDGVKLNEKLAKNTTAPKLS